VKKSLEIRGRGKELLPEEGIVFIRLEDKSVGLLNSYSSSQVLVSCPESKDTKWNK